MPTLLPLTIGIAGLIMSFVSFVLYYARTKDKTMFTRFWLGKDILSKNEYLLNRIGFGLSIVGIVWLLLLRFFL